MGAAQQTQTAHEYLTPDEARKILRLGRNAMYRALAAGSIPGQMRIGNVYRIRRAALEACESAR